MFVVNAGPGFKKMLWPAAQKFLDAKTIAKIQARDMIVIIHFFIIHSLQSGLAILNF